MTIDELNRYRGLKAEAEAIKEELEQIYNTVQSPPLEKIGSKPAGLPTSRTETAAYRAIELRDSLEELQMQISAARQRIEKYIRSVDDEYIRSSMRWHFIQGKSWADTSRKVYGLHAGKDSARVAVRRYLDKDGQK